MMTSLSSTTDIGPSDSTRTRDNVLSVQNLTIDIVGDDSQKALIDNVSFDIKQGETVALIGESGCGKTMTAMSILGLLPKSAHVRSGKILFESTDLLSLSRSMTRKLRGDGIGTIFQDSMASLNPTMTIGDQIAESRVVHKRESWAQGRRIALKMLDQVGIPSPSKRMGAYPHELSGGMQQRVMIAMAIACEPKLLIADEPTTALDVTIQAEILELLSQIQQEASMGILLVTHDLGVVAQNAHRTVVMYAGQVAEKGVAHEVFHKSKHPYTGALLGAIPQKDRAHEILEAIPGRVPPVGTFPTGCRFFSRCRFAKAGVCDTADVSELVEDDTSHSTSCVRWPEISTVSSVEASHA